MTFAIETRGLSKQFGALRVTDDVDFHLAPGARHALIGPNGAGKTTFLNLLTGVLPCSSGTISLEGRDVTGESVTSRARRGLARTFQITSLFRALSVLDNVALCIAERNGVSTGFWRAASRYNAVRDEAFALLCDLGLKTDATRTVQELAYGRQRMIEIAIALASRPRVLLLDEPAAGVPSIESGLITDVLSRLPTDIAILIIEHDMELVFRFAQRITVLVQGRILLEGSPEEVASNQRVRDVYLGESHD